MIKDTDSQWLNVQKSLLFNNTVLPRKNTPFLKYVYLNMRHAVTTSLHMLPVHKYKYTIHIGAEEINALGATGLYRMSSEIWDINIVILEKL